MEKSSRTPYHTVCSIRVFDDDLGHHSTLTSRGPPFGFFLSVSLHRKEVIQPQVPLRLPCYDFIPVTSLTLGSFPLAVGFDTSGATGFPDVTGGVYKTRERIHGTNC